MTQPKTRLTRSRQLVGDALRKIRRDRKLRQLDLADLVNVDHTLISRIETGNMTADPNLMNAIRMTLQLSESEWKWLETCGARCALDSVGVTEAAAIQYQDLLDISTASLQAAVELRAIGNSALAANTTYPIARALSDTFPLAPVRTPAAHSPRNFASCSFMKRSVISIIYPQKAFPALRCPLLVTSLQS